MSSIEQETANFSKSFNYRKPDGIRGEIEEGEIISDNDKSDAFSMSSDEETSLRQRIKELEAKNEELEKISHLSYNNYFPKLDGDRSSYAHCNTKLNHTRPHYRRNLKQIVPEDSSGSSDGLKERTKIRRRKTKTTSDIKRFNNPKNIRINPAHQWYQNQLTTTKKKRQLRNNARNKSRIKKNGQKEIPPSHTAIFSDITVEELSDESFQDSGDIYRETLRFAMGHTLNKRANGRTLKDRLLQDKYANNSKIVKSKVREENHNAMKGVTQSKSRCEKNRENEENSEPEEQELRLIALRSAVLNKHKARKKRDAESAYSPTDFDELFGNNLNSCHATDVNDEFEGFQSPMEISPDNSPKLLLSPIEIDDNSSDCIYTVDTKPVDMDIANSDIENDMEPMSNVNQWSSNYSNKGVSLNIGPVDLRGSACQSIGIGIFDIQSSQIVPNCATALPPAFNYNVLSQDNTQSATVDFIPFSKLSPVNNEKQQHNDANMTPMSQPVSVTDKRESDEEEVEALRALLLSKIRPKNRLTNITEHKSSKQILPQPDGKDLDQEHNSSIDIIGKRRSPQTSILKDAVKRLKMLNDQSCKDNEQEIDAKNFTVENTTKSSPNIQNNLETPQDLCAYGTNQNPGSNSNNVLPDETVSLKPSTSLKSNFVSNQSNTVTLETANKISSMISSKPDEPTKLPNPDKKAVSISSFQMQLENGDNSNNTRIEKSAIKYPKQNADVAPNVHIPTRPIAQVKKIVKPNKVINKNMEKKIGSIEYLKKSTPSVKSTSNTILDKRLVTNVKLNSIPVNKLVISLRASDTETSDDEKIVDTESLSSSIKNNYFENASPLSLPMTSPNGSPARPSSPVAPKTSKSAPLDIKLFEQKLDSFLKDMRSQAKPETLEKSTVNKKSEKFETPTAVCHLPAHVQNEYRQLIHRMKALENEKKRKDVITKPFLQKTDSTAGSNNRLKICKKQNIVDNNVQTKGSTFSQTTEGGNNQKESEQIKESKGLIISSTSKSNDRTLNKTQEYNHDIEQNLSTENGDSSLQTFENSFSKISFHILAHLNKSLKIVEEARTVKEDKLRFELELNEMCKKIEEIRNKIRMQNKQISKIIPNLRTSNEVITNLKKRRNQLYQKTNTLGKHLKGEDYRLIDDNEKEITQKMHLLVERIRNVNSLKCDDVREHIKVNGNKQEKTSLMPSKNTSTENVTSKDISQNVTTNEAVIQNLQSDAISNALEASKSENQKIESSESAIIGIEESKSLLQKNLDIGRRISFSNNIRKRKLVNKIVQRKKMKRAVVKEYISPLDHIRRCNSDLDPNGVLCPFQLWGICDDVNCNYLHLSDDNQIGSEM